MSKKTILKKACGGKGGLDNYSDNTAARSKLGLYTSQVMRPTVPGGMGKTGKTIDNLPPVSKVQPKQAEPIMRAAPPKVAMPKPLMRGMPVTPGNFPTTSPKNKAGEIINPTAKDVTGFNSRFNTRKMPQPLAPKARIGDYLNKSKDKYKRDILKKKIGMLPRKV